MTSNTACPCKEGGNAPAPPRRRGGAGGGDDYEADEGGGDGDGGNRAERAAFKKAANDSMKEARANAWRDAEVKVGRCKLKTLLKVPGCSARNQNLMSCYDFEEKPTFENVIFGHFNS